jgi:hypothetical protein
MDSTVDHKTNKDAVSKDDEFVVINAKRHRKQTTAGWFFNILWKDGTTTLEPLRRLLKESNQIEIAKFVIDNKIASEPSFSWWVPFTLSREDRIAAEVSKR